MVDTPKSVSLKCEIIGVCEAPDSLRICRELAI